MHEIYLGIEKYRSEFWNQLFNLMNMQYQVDWVEYQNQIYFNCTNEWNNPNGVIKKIRQNGRLPCHKDYPCDGYRDCEKTKYNKINIEDRNYFKYVFSGSIDIIDLEMWVGKDEDEEAYGEPDGEKKLNYKNDQGIYNVIVQMQNLDLSPAQIKFILDKDIVISNISGCNKDHRGSDHTILKLPFVKEVNLGKEFTFYDLLTANSNLKSHKFDNNYEMFCKASCITLDNLIKIQLDFNHGS